MQCRFEILELGQEQAEEIRRRFFEAAQKSEELQGKQRVLVLDVITDAVYFQWIENSED